MQKILFRTLFVVVAWLIALPTFADWRFGISASYDNTGAVAHQNGERFSTRNISGFSIGPMVAYEVIDYFSVQSGIEFAMNGFATEEKSLILNVPYMVQDELLLFYLRMPVYAVGQLPLKNDAILLLEAGPQFACGVADVITSTLYMPGTPPLEEESQENVAFDNVLSRFNALMHLAVGAEFMGARIMVGYNFGLFDMSLVEGISLRSGGFTLSIGYMF